MSTSLDRIAELLDNAVSHARAVPQISAAQTISLSDAYEIQKLSIARRLARGERRVGVKMGFTSRAKMQQMGVSDLIWGRLTDAMLAEDGGRIAFSRFVHPRVEPEIAFFLGKNLSGPVTPMQALDAVEAVAPALEIIDSRYENFRFSLTDVVADNSSSSALVVGAWSNPRQSLDNLGMVLSIDGRAQAFCSTAAVLGDPLRSLVAAARLVAESGETIEAGSIVMTGGATAAIELRAGMYVSLEVERLGRTCFTVAE